MPATEHMHLIEQIADSFNTGALDAVTQLVSPSLAGFTRDGHTRPNAAAQWSPWCAVGKDASTRLVAGGAPGRRLPAARPGGCGSRDSGRGW